MRHGSIALHQNVVLVPIAQSDHLPLRTLSPFHKDIYPVMLHTAVVCVNRSRACSHCRGSGKSRRSHSCSTGFEALRIVLMYSESADSCCFFANKSCTCWKSFFNWRASELLEHQPLSSRSRSILRRMGSELGTHSISALFSERQVTHWNE